MRKFIAAVGAALLVTVASASVADGVQLRRHFVSATFILQSSVEATGDTAAAWSKNTNVSVLEGTCAGSGCIQVERTTQANSYCANVNGTVLGCRQDLADGTCLIQMTSDVMFDGYHYELQRSVLEHEVGHCLGLPHKTTDPNSVMQPVIETQQMANQYNTVDAGDRKDVQALYPN